MSPAGAWALEAKTEGTIIMAITKLAWSNNPICPLGRENTIDVMIPRSADVRMRESSLQKGRYHQDASKQVYYKLCSVVIRMIDENTWLTTHQTASNSSPGIR